MPQDWLFLHFKCTEFNFGWAPPVQLVKLGELPQTILLLQGRLRGKGKGRSLKERVRERGIGENKGRGGKCGLHIHSTQSCTGKMQIVSSRRSNTGLKVS